MMRLDLTDEQIEQISRLARFKKSNREILKRFNNGEKRAALALEYGITESAVKSIIRRFRIRVREMREAVKPSVFEDLKL